MIIRIVFIVMCTAVWVLQPSVCVAEFPPPVPNTLHDLTILPAMVKDLSAEERELVDEYRRHYLRVVDLYRNIKMVTEKKHYGRDGMRHRLLTYRSHGAEHLRMDAEWLGEDGNATGQKRVRLARPEGYLIAEREASTAEFTIVGTHPSFDLGAEMVSTYIFQWAPHNVYVQPAHWYFFSNWVHNRFADFRITKVTIEQRGEVELVSFYVSGEGKASGRARDGEFVFERSNGWVVRQYQWGHAQMDSEDDIVRHGSFEYSGSFDGVGLLRKGRYWNTIGPEQREETEREFEVVEIVPGPVPLDEFSPEALGIVRPGRQRVDRTRTLVGLLIGGGLITLYLVLRYRESFTRQTV